MRILAGEHPSICRVYVFLQKDYYDHHGRDHGHYDHGHGLWNDCEKVITTRHEFIIMIILGS